MKLLIKNDMIYEINDICVIDNNLTGEMNVKREIHTRNHQPSPTIC
jgi:hypothetical protein